MVGGVKVTFFLLTIFFWFGMGLINTIWGNQSSLKNFFRRNLRLSRRLEEMEKEKEKEKHLGWKSEVENRSDEVFGYFVDIFNTISFCVSFLVWDNFGSRFRKAFLEQIQSMKDANAGLLHQLLGFTHSTQDE